MSADFECGPRTLMLSPIRVLPFGRTPRLTNFHVNRSPPLYPAASGHAHVLVQGSTLESQQEDFYTLSYLFTGSQLLQATPPPTHATEFINNSRGPVVLFVWCHSPSHDYAHYFLYTWIPPKAARSLKSWPPHMLSFVSSRQRHRMATSCPGHDTVCPSHRSPRPNLECVAG